MSDVRVRLALPLRGTQMHFGAALGAFWHPLKPDDAARVHIQPSFASSSLLPFTFNILWTGALNDSANDNGPTHFAMLHDDICPDPGWLSVLLEELEHFDADIVSAVVPIKDGRGLTSTALDTTGDPFNPYRLTVREAFDRPATFTHPLILLNTGCWVCRLDRPWARQVGFVQRDTIRQGPDGQLSPQTAPEDWNFSRAVRGKGGSKLYATRKATLSHDRAEFHNRSVWGEWSRDQIHPPLNPWEAFRGSEQEGAA